MVDCWHKKCLFLWNCLQKLNLRKWFSQKHQLSWLHCILEFSKPYAVTTITLTNVTLLWRWKGKRLLCNDQWWGTSFIKELERPPWWSFSSIIKKVYKRVFISWLCCIFNAQQLEIAGSHIQYENKTKTIYIENKSAKEIIFP